MQRLSAANGWAMRLAAGFGQGLSQRWDDERDNKKGPFLANQEKEEEKNKCK